jgi:hypothetical protein
MLPAAPRFLPATHTSHLASHTRRCAGATRPDSPSSLALQPTSYSTRRPRALRVNRSPPPPTSPSRSSRAPASCTPKHTRPTRRAAVRTRATARAGEWASMASRGSTSSARRLSSTAHTSGSSGRSRRRTGRLVRAAEHRRTATCTPPHERGRSHSAAAQGSHVHLDSLSLTVRPRTLARCCTVLGDDGGTHMQPKPKLARS